MAPNAELTSPWRGVDQLLLESLLQSQFKGSMPLTLIQGHPCASRLGRRMARNPSHKPSTLSYSPLVVHRDMNGPDHAAPLCLIVSK